MKPTKPNKTGRHTAADVVMTPENIAQLIVNRLPLYGSVLEPARGDGAFFRALVAKCGAVDWCEISDGVDFLRKAGSYDWIVTNPPYSIYDEFLKHSFELADNVVFLTPLAKALKSNKVQRLVSSFGGLYEIYWIGTGTSCGFNFGFPVGTLHYRRGYRGPIHFAQHELGAAGGLLLGAL